MLRRLLITLALLGLAQASWAQRFAQSDSILVGPHRFAEVGQYFCAETQTPGTAYDITGATQNAWVVTTPTFTVFNGASAASGKRIFLDIAKVTFATAGTGGTRTELALAVDDIQRYASGGTSLAVKNVNMDSTITSTATVFGGAITAAAAGANVRYVSRAMIAAAAPGPTTYSMSFGAGYVSTSTGANIATLPTAIVGPGGTALIYLWMPGLSAQPTGEVMVCWIEK